MFPNQANQNINMNYINRIRNMEDMFYQMNPNSGPFNINMKNNKNSLISIINNSIMVPKHPHPLYSCLLQKEVSNPNFGHATIAFVNIPFKFLLFIALLAIMICAKNVYMNIHSIKSKFIIIIRMKNSY